MVGFITAKNLKKLTGPSESRTNEDENDLGGEQLSLSAFSNLLSENMKDRYFPKGRVLYKEGEIGNSMLFVNSGMLEVTTKDGYSKLTLLSIVAFLVLCP
jgi:CRP-like cAMP-binding protein